MRGEKIMLHEGRFYAYKVRWNIGKFRKLEFQVFQCLVQSEVKNITLVESSLHEVRFKIYKVGLSHQSVCSLLDFLFILTLLTRTIKPKFYTIERIFLKKLWTDQSPWITEGLRLGLSFYGIVSWAKRGNVFSFRFQPGSLDCTTYVKRIWVLLIKAILVSAIRFKLPRKRCWLCEKADLFKKLDFTSTINFWNDQINQISCCFFFQDGKMSCVREKRTNCPRLTCPRDQQFSVQGQCCDFCRGTFNFAIQI